MSSGPGGDNGDHRPPEQSDTDHFRNGVFASSRYGLETAS